ncbi:MAG: hypothetical protein OQL06_15405 [Gammaproteobacteria bacterium]|nr:hypothetical protein [Gammaproteobacteria bacterium]
MESTQINIIKFSVNNWSHLYSLAQAINRAEEATGKNLCIQGKVLDLELLDHKDLAININFHQVDGIPGYQKTAAGELILGQMLRRENKLECELAVDDRVFEELKKNLMEYADIDGIHIVVSIGLLIINNEWPVDQSVDIVKLDYAMRGDA